MPLQLSLCNPVWQKVGGPIVLAYFLPGPLDYDQFDRYHYLLTHLGVGTQFVQPDGTLKGDVDADLLGRAWGRGVVPLAMIQNYEDGFKRELARGVMEDPVKRRNFVVAVAALLAQYPFGGINLDFELLRPEDRELYVDLVGELNAVLGGRWLLTLAVPARSSERETWYDGYDYAGLAALSDWLLVMTYDEHWAGGDPGPIASIPWVERVVRYLTEREGLPREKFVLGVPLYGYNWPVPRAPGARARAEDYFSALVTAQRMDACIAFDGASGEPYFAYRLGGVNRLVWFQDERSIARKLEVACRYGLPGVGVWRIGQAFPGFWRALAQWRAKAQVPAVAGWSAAGLPLPGTLPPLGWAGWGTGAPPGGGA